MTPGEVITLKEHFDALREADAKLALALRDADAHLREAIRIGDLALQAERDRSTEQLETTRATALAAALLTVKEKNETAILSVAKAADVLALQSRADKAAANEWRGTVNDIISKVGGMRALWGIIAALIGLAFLVWNSLKSEATVKVSPNPLPVIETPAVTK